MIKAFPAVVSEGIVIWFSLWYNSSCTWVETWIRVFILQGTIFFHVYIHICVLFCRGFLCSKCKRKFATQLALDHHLETASHHFPCPYCGKVFTWERYLRRHLPTHVNYKSFLCSQCGKSFRTEQYLKAHLLTHSAERPYACQVRTLKSYFLVYMPCLS